MEIFLNKFMKKLFLNRFNFEDLKNLISSVHKICEDMSQTQGYFKSQGHSLFMGKN